jgi:hypothetical protein
VIDEASLKTLDAQQLREVVRSLMVEVDKRDREIAFKQATIDKITHEMAVLKRLKFAAKSEALQPRAEEPAGRGDRRGPRGAAARARAVRA